ncbi:ImmA/IrrE family metallo-endopeptidase [Nonomuraea longicatena]|uniref:ImmA/IrrE family metallo-endopeptidase n=1 Tax=Nonomuraea longicatena TaxID=83682 RepID=A0ABP4ALH1_9ACTN
MCRQSEALLDSLGLPRTFTISELCRRVEERRDRSIHLIARELPVRAPHGLWVAGQHADYVFFDNSIGPVRQYQIIAHELGHMLFDDDTAASDARELLAMLSPELDHSTVRKIQQRNSYAEPAELRAELFGTVAVQRTQTWSALSWSRPAAPEQLARLIETLEGGAPRP